MIALFKFSRMTALKTILYRVAALPSLRNWAAGVSLVLLSSCSDASEPPHVDSSLRQSGQALTVLPPSEALPLLLADSSDPALDGLVPTANAAEAGMWSPVFFWPLNGLHSTLLPNGKVLTYGTPADAPATQDGRTLDTWDPSLGFDAQSHVTDFDAQRVNSFCSSAAFNSDGTLMITGGNSPLDSSIYNPGSAEVTTSPFELASERWYGSMITLPDGRFLMMGGSGPYDALRAHLDPVGAINAGDVAMTPEIFEPGLGFRSLFGANSREAFGPDHHRYWYPRAWVAPSGEVFGISSEQMWFLDYTGEGSVRSAGTFKTGVDSTTKPNIGPTSTAVLFAPGRILQVGGNGYYDGHATPSSALATIIDINGAAPLLTETAPMHHARQWANSLVLPDGKVAVTGGTAFGNNGGSDAVYAAELWDPDFGQWTLGASAAAIRVYHSTTILMPNGTILSTGGGAPGPVNNQNAELYYPPYLFRPKAGGGAELAPRPRAVAISSLAPEYDGVLQLDLAGDSEISEVVLLAAASTSHSFNTSQRRVPLVFVKSGARLAIRMPQSGSDAPPGYYLLFVLDEQGAVSRGVTIALGESVVAPPMPITLPQGAVATFESVAPAGYALSVDAGGAGVLANLGADPTEDVLHPARFLLLPGLADQDCVSFESVRSPGLLLHESESRLRLGVNDASPEFAGAATFCPRPGLAGEGISFFSHVFPDRVIRHQDGELRVDQILAEPGPDQEPSAFELSATFVLRPETIPSLSPVNAPARAVGDKVELALQEPIPGAVYSWDFGDDSETTGESTIPSVSHVFEDPGMFLVTLTVRLADGRRIKKTLVQAIGPQPVEGRASSSSQLGVGASPGGERLWVANPDNNSVTVFDVESLAKLAEVSLLGSPRSLALTSRGDAWVVSDGPAVLSKIDAETLTVEREIALAPNSRPGGLVLLSSPARAYITLEATGEIAVVDIEEKRVDSVFEAGPSPRGLALSPGGEKLWVSRFISPPVPGESTRNPDVASAVGEVRTFELFGAEPPGLLTLIHNDVPDSSVEGRGVPNYLGSPVISPDGASVWIPSKQDNIARGTGRDGNALDYQNTVRAVISRVDVASGRELLPRLDLDNAGLATSALFHPSGVYLFVTLETSREVAVISALSNTELFRFSVGRAPQGLALSEDGRLLFVHNFMDRNVSVVSIAPLVENGEFHVAELATLSAVETETLSPQILLGKQLFYDAADRRLARDAYLSCASCHADGGHDGRVWDLTSAGEGVRNTISLRGMDLRDGPLHFSGNFDEIQDFETQIRDLSSGSGLLSDGLYFFGTREEPLGATKIGLSEDLDALSAYVRSLSGRASPHRRGQPSPESEKGRLAFLGAGCHNCHYGQSYSDEDEHRLVDIGTITDASGKRLGAPLEGINVPSLLGVWESAPYLHDGSALTLEEAVSAHEGVILDNEGASDVVGFLLELDRREPPMPKYGCADGIENGQESGVDCGGDCEPCALAPDDPEDPDDPEKPDDPDLPVTPDPDDPDDPEEPDDPDHPVTPDPDDPVTPDHPDDPEEPEEPDDPDHPVTPDPDDPVTPDHPDDPEEPDDAPPAETGTGGARDTVPVSGGTNLGGAGDSELDESGSSTPTDSGCGCRMPSRRGGQAPGSLLMMALTGVLYLRRTGHLRARAARSLTKD